MIVLIAMLASACAAGGYSVDSLHDRLVETGMPPSQATCVIDAMVDKFGDDQLNARVAPILAEIRAERALLRECRRKSSKSA